MYAWRTISFLFELIKLLIPIKNAVSQISSNGETVYLLPDVHVSDHLSPRLI